MDESFRSVFGSRLHPLSPVYFISGLEILEILEKFQFKHQIQVLSQPIRYSLALSPNIRDGQQSIT